MEEILSLESPPLSSLAASAINIESHINIEIARCENSDLECGICYLGFGEKDNHDLMLGCGCIIHLKCLVRYLKSKIEDKESILGILRRHKQAVTNASSNENDMNNIDNENSNIRSQITRSESITDNDDLEVFCCPFYVSRQCKYKETELGKVDPDDKYFITLKDLSFIIDLQNMKKLEQITVDGVSPRFSPRQGNNSPRIGLVSRSISDEEVTLTEEIISKLQSWILDDKPVVIDPTQTEKFTNATTKACPNCQYRSTHYHGHACHHISPSGGCINCKTEYCYKCLATAEQNRKERRSSSNCLCGGWSNFCVSDDSIFEHLVLDPYPYDSRCGCIICPDCRFGKNCRLCSRDCVVCRGIVNPAPYELGTVYNPKSMKYIVNQKVKLVIPLVRQNDLAQVRKILEDNSENFDIDCEDNTNKNLLTYACAENGGNEEFMKMLIELGADVNRKNPSGYSPLIKSLIENWTTAVHVLLKSEAVDINSVDNDNTSVLMWACSHARFISDLLAFPNIDINHRSDRGNTALIVACQTNNLNSIDLLLSVSRIEVNVKNNSGETCLHYCRNANIMSKLLSREGIDINVQNSKGNTPLIKAIEEKAHECVELLLNHPNIDVNISNEGGEFALFSCCENGCAQYLKKLLEMNSSLVNTQREDGNTCLIRSCYYGFNDIVKQLLDVSEIDVLIQSGLGNTALLIAIRQKHANCIDLLMKMPKIYQSINIVNNENESCIYHCVETDNHELLRKFLDEMTKAENNDEKFDINIQTVSTGDNALIRSCYHGFARCTQMLIELPNLDVNLQNKNGFTALMVSSEFDRIECLELLLKLQQVNCNIQADNGSTALSRACSRNKKACVKLLLQKEDIEVNIKDNEGFSALATAASRNSSDSLLLLLDHPKVDINSTTLKGDSILMLAMKVDNMNTINLLLSLPIDYKVQNSLGESALYLACSVGNKESVKRLLSFDDIDVNICTSANVTPLMKACEGCYYEIIELLLERPEILVNVKNNTKGSNALMLAITNSNRGRYNPEVKINCVKTILKFPGLDINAKDNDNNSALVLAANCELDIVEALLNVEAIECSGAIFNEQYTLIKCIEEDNIELMKRLLKFPDIDINVQDDDDRATALTTAVVKGRKDFVDVLLTVPTIDINVSNTYGTTALMLACREGEFDIMNLLLARPEVQLNLTNEDGKCALFRACEGEEKKEGRIKCVQRLLELDDLDINIQNNDGLSSLMVAMNSNNTEIAKLLLKPHKKRSSLQLNLLDSEGDSALHIAGYNNDTVTMKLLIEQSDVDVNILNNEGQSSLIGCAERGHLECVRLLVLDPRVNANIVDRANFTALTRAASESHSQTVRLLLEHNVQITIEQIREYKIMHLICSAGAHAIIEKLLDAIQSIDINMINMRDEDSCTPLMKAIHRDSTADHEKVVQILLSREGIDVNAFRQGSTAPSALHRAAEANKIGCLKLLLGVNDINMNFQNTEGTTAIMLAAYYGYHECIDLMIAAPSINMNIVSNRGNTALHIATRENKRSAVETILKHSTGDLNILNNEGDTPLSIASKNGLIEILKLILAKPTIDVNVVDHEGQTALVKALKNGKSECAKLLLNHSSCAITADIVNQHKILLYMAKEGDVESLKMMLQYENLDLSLPFQNGNTALHESISKGKTQCSKLLLEYLQGAGAVHLTPDFLNHRNGNGNSLLMLSAHKGDIYSLTYLLTLPDVDVNIINNDGHSAVTLSIMSSFDECLQLLLQRTINLDLKVDGRNILLYATYKGSRQCLERICEKPEYWNVLINNHDNDGNTALMVAAMGGFTECVQFLLDRNCCSTNIKNNNGDNALSLAVKYNKHECVNLLLKQEDLESIIENNMIDINLLLSLTAESGDLEKFSKIIERPNVDLNHPDREGRTVLHRAAKVGHVEIMKLILDHKKTNVHAQDNKGLTPLMLSIIFQSNRECIDMLTSNTSLCCKNCENIACSLDVYRCTTCSIVYCEPCTNANILPRAAMVSNHPHVLKATSTNGWNCDGRHLLGGCRSSVNVHLTSVDVRYRCDSCDYDYCERCLNEYAISSEEVDDISPNMMNMVDVRNHPHHLTTSNLHPINLETTNMFNVQPNPYPRGTTCLHIAANINDFTTMKKLLSIAGINVNARDSEGDSALNLCAVSGFLECTNLLLEYPSIDVNIRNRYGTTALMLACREGHDQIVSKLVEMPGINFNIQNEQGNTALHRCAEKCYFECIRILLEKRINPTIVNNKGETALDMALEGGDEDCVALLLSAMCDESSNVVSNDNNNDDSNNNNNEEEEDEEEEEEEEEEDDDDEIRSDVLY